MESIPIIYIQVWPVSITSISYLIISKCCVSVLIVMSGDHQALPLLLLHCSAMLLQINDIYKTEQHFEDNPCFKIYLLISQCTHRHGT